MFVKFECGCIGIIHGHSNQNRAKTIVVKACDDGNVGGLLSFLYRDMSDKRYNAMAKAEEDEFVRGIDILIADGYDLREMRRILKEE